MKDTEEASFYYYIYITFILLFVSSFVLFNTGLDIFEIEICNFNWFLVTSVIATITIFTFLMLLDIYQVLPGPHLIKSR